MYDIAKKARSGMKAKAQRLAGEKDRKTDSSDWSPAEPLNADVKTGMRPVSRRAYKKGGAVQGEMAKGRADRKPRKAGGKVEQKGEQPLVDRYINRDLKKANEYRDGKKHVGALKHGGRAHKADGGSMTMEEMIKKNPAPVKKAVPLPPRRPPENVTPAANNPIKPDMKKYMPGDVITGPPKQVRKDGGKVHSDAKEDKALIKKMIKESEAKEKCYGGRAKKADGGMMMDPRLGIVKPKAMEFGQNVVTPGLKKGGRVAKANGGSAEFKSAFRAARNAFLAGEGPKNFEFKGKSYSTDLAKTPTTTGPSTRGRGTTVSPERRIQKNITVEFGPPKTGMPDVDVMGNPTGGGMKKGGRIAKQIGGGLGRMLGRAMPQTGMGGQMTRPGFGMGRPMQPPPATTMPTNPIGGGMGRPMQPPMATTDQGLMSRIGPMPPNLGGGQMVGQYQIPIGNTPGIGSTEGLNADQLAQIRASQPSGGIDVPPPRGPNGDFMATTMPLNPRFGQIAADQQMISEMQNRGPSVGLTKGPMMGQMPMQQFVGQPQMPMSQSQAMANMGVPQMPMARKSGGRVARAYGGEINEQSEGKHKSKGKGKDTHVNIVIAMGKGDQQDMGQQMPMNAPPPPMPMNTPPAPMGGAPMPPPAMGGGMPPMPPDGMMPPMPRKAGGRVSKVAHSYKDMTAGAGSGEGRLQKTDIAKRSAHKAGGKVYRSYKDMDAGSGSGKGRLEKTEIQARKK